MWCTSFEFGSFKDKMGHSSMICWALDVFQHVLNAFYSIVLGNVNDSIYMGIMFEYLPLKNCSLKQHEKMIRWYRTYIVPHLIILRHPHQKKKETNLGAKDLTNDILNAFLFLLWYMYIDQFQVRKYWMPTLLDQIFQLQMVWYTSLIKYFFHHTHNYWYINWLDH